MRACLGLDVTALADLALLEFMQGLDSSKPYSHSRRKMTTNNDRINSSRFNDLRRITSGILTSSTYPFLRLYTVLSLLSELLLLDKDIKYYLEDT